MLLELIKGVSGTYFGSEVLQNSRAVNGSGGSDASMAGCTALQMPVDSADRELKRNK